MALRELKRYNIVSIFDEGYSENQKSYFIVLEWLEKNYTDYVTENKNTDWAIFFNNIGRHILDA